MKIDNDMEYFILEVIGNRRTKSNDQISDWHHPEVEELKRQMDNHDWTKAFEFEMTDKPLVAKFDDILKSDALPDKLDEIGKFILFDSSSLTDFIKGSFLSQYGLIVSDKARGLLEQLNLGERRFYPLTISHKGVDYNDYFFLKCRTNSEGFIDFSRSEFYIQKGYFDKKSKRDVSFKTRQDLSDFRAENANHGLFLFANKIKLDGDFPGFDIFQINEFGINEIFVTSNFKRQLDQLTGIILTKSEMVF